MFRAKHLLWKNHPKVTLLLCHPAPVPSSSQHLAHGGGDWMELTCGARVASPKEGADTSTVTFHCHLLVTSACSATQKSMQNCLLCVHIQCWPQAEEASVSWSDAILKAVGCYCYWHSGSQITILVLL